MSDHKNAPTLPPNTRDTDIDEILTQKLFKQTNFKNGYSSGKAYRFKYPSDVTKAVTEAKAAITKKQEASNRRAYKAGYDQAVADYEVRNTAEGIGLVRISRYVSTDVANPPESLAKKLTEIEKAYGGCRNCYGKGYATARVGTSSRYGNATHDTIKYCICERGKQLEALTGKKLNDTRIDELNQVRDTIYSFLHTHSVSMNEKGFIHEVDYEFERCLDELQATKDET